MKYKLVNSDDAISFSSEVTKLLDQGWTLYGFTFSKGEKYCQALLDVSDEIALMQKEYSMGPQFMPEIDPRNIN